MKIICSNCSNNFEVEENQTTAVCPSCRYPFNLPAHTTDVSKGLGNTEGSEKIVCQYMSNRPRSGFFWFVCGAGVALLLAVGFSFIFLYKSEPIEKKTEELTEEKSPERRKKSVRPVSKPVPLMPRKSKYTDLLVDSENYPEAKAPGKPLNIKWDFSNKHTYAYQMSAKMESIAYMDSDKPLNQYVDLNGNLLIKSQGDKTANVVMDEIVMNQKIGDQKPREMKYPVKVIQGMKEDGNFDIDDRFVNRNIDLFSPLPNKTLNVGESSEVYTTMPFNAMGSLLKMKIKHKLTLTGYVIINNHTCARLELDVTSSDMDIPNEIKDKYEFIMEAKGVLYYDLVDSAIISYVSCAISGIHTESEMPKDKDGIFPEKMYMTMWGDAMITLKRNLKKEKEEN